MAAPSTPVNLAPGPRGEPFIGNLRSFTGDYLGTTIRGFKEYGEIVRFRVGPRIIHILSHPDLAHYVLVEHNQEFPKLDSSSGLATALGNGLLGNSDHTSWLRQRRMMQPMFHRTKRLAGMAGRIVGAGDRLLARWQKLPPGTVVNMAEEMAAVTLDTINTTMFTADVMGEVDKIGPAVAVGVRWAQNKVQNPLAAPRSWPTPLNRAFKNARQTVDTIVYRLIRERRAGQPQGDLLDMLLEARDEDTGEGMTDEEVHDEVLTMFVAGHDTTANALTWTWHMLSQHPEVMARLKAEVDTVLEGRPPALEDIPRLSYLQQVFNEVLRFSPAVPQTGPRRVLKDTTIRGYDIPAGSRLIVSIFNIHRHPDFWLDPLRFDPERWAGQHTEARHRQAFMPFGAGPRLCIGYSLALMEAHLLIAQILQHYEPRLVPGRTVIPEVAIIMRPKGGLPMTLQPRR